VSRAFGALFGRCAARQAALAFALGLLWPGYAAAQGQISPQERCASNPPGFVDRESCEHSFMLDAVVVEKMKELLANSSLSKPGVPLQIAPSRSHISLGGGPRPLSALGSMRLLANLTHHLNGDGLEEFKKQHPDLEAIHKQLLCHLGQSMRLYPKAELFPFDDKHVSRASNLPAWEAQYSETMKQLESSCL
jgi:hypothetical protein